MRRLRSGAVALAVILGASPLPAWSQASGFGNTPARPPAPVQPAPIAPPPAAGPIVRPQAPASVAPPPVVVAPPAPLAPPPTVATAPGIVLPAAGPFAVEQSATGFTVRNLSATVGTFTYVVPRLEIAGTSLAAADVARLFDPASGAPLAERVGTVSASSIQIPEFYTSWTSNTGAQVTLQRDTRMSNVAGGKAASVVIGETTAEVTIDGRRSEARYERTEIRDLHVANMVSVLTERAPAGPAPALQPFYSSATVEGVTQRDGQRVFRIARMAARDVGGRRTPDSWTGTVTRLLAAPKPPQAGGPPSPEQVDAFSAVLDLLSAVEIGSMEAIGLVGSGASATDADVKVARVGFRGGEGRAPELTIDGLEAGQAGNGVTLGSMTATGLTIMPMLKVVNDLQANPESKPGPADIRRMMPASGSIRVSDMRVRSDVSGRSQQVGFGSFEFGFGKPIEGMPSDIELGLRNVSLPIDPTDPAVQPIVQLGFDRIEGTLAASLGYDEKASSLLLRELSARATGMGSIAIKAVLGNVSRDLFDPDQTLAMVAAVGATVQSLDVTVENGGLFEKVVARQAAETGRSAAEIRRDYGLAAAVGIPVMLGNSAAAKELGQAVARFVAKPGRLAIQVRARDPAGLGFTDFAAAADPTLLLDKIDITAVAE